MKRQLKKSAALALGLGLAVAAGACGDLLDITNPGQIDAEGLNDPSAIPGLIVGMSADLSYGLIAVAADGSIAADEHNNGATETGRSMFDAGILAPEYVNSHWDRMQRSRWVAETGIERIREMLGDDFETVQAAPRAHLFAGFSNRILGENFCEAVIDGGPAEPRTVYLERAMGQFSEARRLAQLQGEGAWVHAALAGMAQIAVNLGDWSAAVGYAEQVPVDFVFEAIFSANSSRENNSIYHDTHRAANSRLTVEGTFWDEVTDDPRVPWEIDRNPDGSVRLTPNRARPAYIQQKYADLGANVPLAKGTEMLLIRAEAALRGGDLGATTDLINQQRAFYGMDPLPVPGTVEEAWTLLQQERGAVLWLESRRLADLRRWQEVGLNDFLADRDDCFPISERERSANPNLS